MKRSIMVMLVVSTSLLSFARKEDNDPAGRKKLLTMVGSMLEQKHYLHPIINDGFSREVWNSYIHFIDPRKYILLQADIDRLALYKEYLDNEIHGDSLKFFPETMKLYAKRYEETEIIFKQLLSQPFRFDKMDSIVSDQEPPDFPKNEEERISRWRNSLRRMTLEKLVELQELRTESKPGGTTYHKTDTQLEKLARESLLKLHERMLTRFRSFDEDKRFSVYLNVIVHSVDPHTDYFPPLDKQAFDQSMSSRYAGIGAPLKEEEDGNIIIVGLDPGGPAWKSGAVSINDRVVKVGQGKDGALKDVEGMTISEVVQLIRGDKGTVVRIGCRKADGRTVVVPLVREEMKIKETLARSAIIWKDGKKTGYINLPVFYDDFEHAEGAHCADDVAREVAGLQAENVNSIIIDLRNNGGGSLNQAIKMAGLFIGSGPVVQVRTGSGSGEVLSSSRAEPLYSGPLTILVNALSASASEIFAAAIQDYGRGIIIGSTTLGKGTVQSPWPLGEDKNGVLKLTVQKFYRINGGSTQLKGVIPDIVFPDTYETLKLREGDRPSALDWDRIQPADFVPQGNINLPQAAARLADDTVFKVIRKNNAWLEDYLDKHAHNMPLTEYRADLLQRRKIAKQNETIQLLPENKRMDVRPLPGDTKEGDAVYQKWLKSISADIYIDRAQSV